MERRLQIHIRAASPGKQPDWTHRVPNAESYAIIPVMPDEPNRFEQFFSRGSSGDWVYFGYGPDISGRVVGYDEMQWLLNALPILSRWKRWAVGLFSVPLLFLIAGVVNVGAHMPGTETSQWVFERIRFLAALAAFLFLGFIVSHAWIGLQPLTREFARLVTRLQKEDSMGIDKFMKNIGAVNGRLVTCLLMLAVGAIFVPGTVRRETASYFSPFTLIWLWCTYHALAGAFWKPEPEDEP